MVVDVFHSQRPRSAVLYRTVFPAWLRQLYARPCGAAVLKGHLERAQVSGFSCGAPFRQAAEQLRQLWPALEPVNEATHEIGGKQPSSRRAPVVSAIIPCLDEEAAIGQVVTAV